MDEVKVQGQEALAVKASRKLVSEEMLITAFAGTRLRHELDRIPLWQGDDISVRALWELFAQYVYLPRLRDQSVFLGAVQSGVASLTWNPDTFAYAEGRDEKAERYLGLTGGQQCTAILDSNSLLVKPEKAAAQVSEEQGVEPSTAEEETEGAGEGEPQSLAGPAAAVLRRFMAVALDPVRANKNIAAGTGASQPVPRAEPLVHLSSALVGSARPVAVQHGSVLPTHQSEDRVVVGTSQPQVVRRRVPELVGFDDPLERGRGLRHPLKGVGKLQHRIALGL